MKIVDGFKLRDVMGQATIIGEGVEQVNFSKLITLNSSAAYLWEAVQGRDFEVADLATLLEQRYEVEAQTAQRDAKLIVGQWLENGIVE